jgi:hypothetical protein
MQVFAVVSQIDVLRLTFCNAHGFFLLCLAATFLLDHHVAAGEQTEERHQRRALLLQPQIES